MATLTTDKQVQYSPVLEGDVIEVAKAIKSAKKVFEDAKADYEQRLLGTPVIWASKMSDADISRKSGVSKAMVAIYRRTGLIISFAPSAGTLPSDIAELVNDLHNASGSSGRNIDPHLRDYRNETDEPTWAGAVAYLKKVNNIKEVKPKKTDSQKADQYIKSLTDLVSKKGYVLSTEQKAALDTLK